MRLNNLHLVLIALVATAAASFVSVEERATAIEYGLEEGSFPGEPPDP